MMRTIVDRVKPRAGSAHLAFHSLVDFEHQIFGEHSAPHSGLIGDNDCEHSGFIYRAHGGGCKWVQPEVLDLVEITDFLVQCSVTIKENGPTQLVRFGAHAEWPCSNASLTAGPPAVPADRVGE